jgi:hypothetical protein
MYSNGRGKILNLLHEFLGFVPTIILRMHANSLNPVTTATAAAATAVVVVDMRVGRGTGGPFPARKPAVNMTAQYCPN